MKKVISIFLILIMIFSFSGCFYDAKVDNVKIIIENTTKFSKEEIDEAAEAVKKYFKQNIKGCELRKLVFNQKEKDHEKECDYQISKGYTKENILYFNHNSEIYCFWSENGVLTRGMTYNWSFTLARENKNSPWEVISYGFG